MTYVFNPPPGAKSGTVRARSTPRGTGRYAQEGVGTPIEQEISFRVTSTLPDASVAVSLTDIPTLDDSIDVVVGATGDYDIIYIDWDIELGPGGFVDHFVSTEIAEPNTGIANIPDLDEGTLGVVVLTPSGGNYDEREYEFQVPSGGAFVEYKDELVAPVTSLNNIPDLDENEFAEVIVTATGEVGEECDYECEVVSGGGGLVPYFVSREPQAPDVMTRVI